MRSVRRLTDSRHTLTTHNARAGGWHWEIVATCAARGRRRQASRSPLPTAASTLSDSTSRQLACAR
eukprot:4645420-Prymnesium_polylepis.1